MDEYLRWNPPDRVPTDGGAWLAVGCGLLGGVAWLIAALIALAAYVFGDLAAILAGSGGARLGLVAAYLVALLCAGLLGAAGLLLGGRSRRDVRSGRAQRGARVALLGMASSVVLLVLLLALALLTIQVTEDEYANAVRCAQPGVCIDP